VVLSLPGDVEVQVVLSLPWDVEIDVVLNLPGDVEEIAAVMELMVTLEASLFLW